MNDQKKVVIVDYGLGNLYSLKKALECFHSNIIITDKEDIITSADALVIPGVGAFAAGMEGLRVKNLIEPLQSFAETGKPVLGICLGAQLMLDTGYEIEEYEGLGIIAGKVIFFPESVGQNEKIPHIGWNGIYSSKEVEWEGTVLSGIRQKEQVYFVHSYIMVPDNAENILSFAEYGGVEFCATTKQGNVYGTQFHPEKSGETGLRILKNFISLV